MFWQAFFLLVGVTRAFALTAAETYLEQGTSLEWTSLEKFQPAHAVLQDEARKGRWNLRTTGWYRKLLNGAEGVPDLTYDPQLKGYYNVRVLYRCVDAGSSFGLKLSSEPQFQHITPALAPPTNHWDDELLWRQAAHMDGEKITLRALGPRVYFYGLRFTPVSQQKVGMNVGEHVVIMKEDNKHFAFPGVAKAKNGDLLVVAREGKQHVAPGDYGTIALTRSKDNGRTWEKRVTIAERPRHDLRDPSIICLSNGTLLVTCTDGVRSSLDNGYTWDGPFTAPVFSPNGLAEGPDGNVYYVGLQRKGEIQFTSIIQSRDKGKTWQPYATIWLSRGYVTSRRDYLDEPNLFIANNRWMVTYRYETIDRTNKGYLYQQVSDDRGDTWCWPRKTVMWGQPGDVIEVLDGRLLCVYGYRRPPFGIRAAVSRDRGETWDIGSEIVVRNDGGGSSQVSNDDLGYAKSILLSQDRVLTVYYFNSQATSCYIAGSFYAPPN
jgi:hypothetical protein